MSKNKEFLIVTLEERKRIQGTYGKSESDIKVSVEKLKDWLDSQAHLPNIQDDGELERHLLNNKFSVEKTKKKLENLFTFRSVCPKYFFYKDILSEDMVNLRKSMLMSPMPILAPTLERITIFKFQPAADHWNIESFCSQVIMLFDLSNKVDYAMGYSHVIDLEHFSYSHLKKANIIMFFNFFRFHQDSFSSRLKTLNFINTSSLMSTLMQCLKFVLPTKIFRKIQIHRTLADLHEEVPPHCLTKEYGGSLKSLQYYNDRCVEEMIHHREWFNNRRNVKSDESLREKIPNKGYGFVGSFRNFGLT